MLHTECLVTRWVHATWFNCYVPKQPAAYTVCICNSGCSEMKARTAQDPYLPVLRGSGKSPAVDAECAILPRMYHVSSNMRVRLDTRQAPSAHTHLGENMAIGCPFINWLPFNQTVSRVEIVRDERCRCDIASEDHLSDP